MDRAQVEEDSRPADYLQHLQTIQADCPGSNLTCPARGATKPATLALEEVKTTSVPCKLKDKDKGANLKCPASTCRTHWDIYMNSFLPVGNPDRIRAQHVQCGECVIVPKDSKMWELNEVRNLQGCLSLVCTADLHQVLTRNIVCP